MAISTGKKSQHYKISRKYGSTHLKRSHVEPEKVQIAYAAKIHQDLQCYCQKREKTIIWKNYSKDHKQHEYQKKVKNVRWIHLSSCNEENIQFDCFLRN